MNEIFKKIPACKTHGRAIVGLDANGKMVWTCEGKKFVYFEELRNQPCEFGWEIHIHIPFVPLEADEK